MEKMSRGDLGWKITLRRGNELAEIADSVTRASESLPNGSDGSRPKPDN